MPQKGNYCKIWLIIFHSNVNKQWDGKVDILSYGTDQFMEISVKAGFMDDG